MASSDIKAGRAYVELMLKDSKFIQGLKAASRQLKSFGSGAMALGAGITAAGSAVVGPIIAAVKHFAAFGSELADASARTGIAAGALAELGFAAEQTGSSLSDVGVGVKKMQKLLVEAADGSDTAVESLANLGLTVAELKGLEPDKQFEKIAEQIAAIPDPARRAAAAMEVFGKSGVNLLPMLGDLKALRQQARDLELIPSEEAVASADKVGDAIDIVGRTIGSTFFEIGAAVADVVLDALDTITGIAVAVTKWTRENKELIATVFKVGVAIMAAGAAVSAIGLAIYAAGIALSGLVAGFGVLSTVLAAVLSPVGLITAAVVAGIYAFTQYTTIGKAALNGVLGVVSELGETVKDTFGGIFDAIASGDLKLAGAIAMAGLKLAFLQGLSAIASTFGGGFGDFLATIGQQIGGGDFKGAWDTAVLAMSAIWDGFCEGIVAVFTNAARAVVDVWQKTTTALADFILEDAANGGVLGRAAMIGSGLDVQEEMKRGNLLDVKSREKAKVRREELSGQLESAEFNGYKADADWLRQEIADIDKRLGRTPTNALDAMKTDAATSLGSSGDKMRAALAEQDKAAQAKAREAEEKLRQRTGGGASALNDSLNDEQRQTQGELDALLAQAAEQRAEQARKRALAADAAGGIPEPEDLGGKAKVFGSFSAAAAMAQGQGGGGAMDKIATNTGMVVELAKERNRLALEDQAIAKRTSDQLLTLAVLK